MRSLTSTSSFTVAVALRLTIKHVDGFSVKTE